MVAEYFSGHTEGKAGKMGTSGGWRVSLQSDHEAYVLWKLYFLSSGSSEWRTQLVREGLRTVPPREVTVKFHLKGQSVCYQKKWGQDEKKPSPCDEMEWEVSFLHLIFINTWFWSQLQSNIINKLIRRKCFFWGDAVGVILASWNWLCSKDLNVQHLLMNCEEVHLKVCKSNRLFVLP